MKNNAHTVERIKSKRSHCPVTLFKASLITRGIKNSPGILLPRKTEKFNFRQVVRENEKEALVPNLDES